ncbi:hypothetical protein SAMN05444671_3336 [Flavobacterium sp. CF108]|jgi:hypothetical protein|uniref:hypothetical protein n=2 Tax=Flavobacterium TaxID=237 RepID=UPI0008B0D21D|nr:MULTISPECIES: hypothetical protein [unclassified Flavobacterium]SEO39657.1 hypothetical protein SAMN04487978_2770 [Flavobacterium sp. fv08]SHH66292.1 hypothetical protein SAMN05444671_3336 [Flavobacterium sp. CF108]
MTIEQIKEKTLYGDYTLLGQVMGINAPAAKMRFFRGDEIAKKALLKIIANREALIKEFQKKTKIGSID